MFVVGIFQLPLIEGCIPADILKSSNPYREITQRLANKNNKSNMSSKNNNNNNNNNSLKLTDGCSIFVKVCNPLLGDLVNLDLNNNSSIVETLFLDNMTEAASAGNNNNLGFGS